MRRSRSSRISKRVGVFPLGPTQGERRGLASASRPLPSALACSLPLELAPCFANVSVFTVTLSSSTGEKPDARRRFHGRCLLAAWRIDPLLMRSSICHITSRELMMGSAFLLNNEHRADNLAGAKSPCLATCVTSGIRRRRDRPKLPVWRQSATS